MRLPTTTVLSLSLAVLALAGCSNNTAAAPNPTSSTAATGTKEHNNPAAKPMSSAALANRLLDESDLGEGYTRRPETTARHDDVTVIGCPALAKLGGQTAVGSSLDFPRSAKVSFTYAGSSGSEVSEELYSDTPAKLSTGVTRIFNAMTSCSTYQVSVGSTLIDMQAQKTSAPRLGDEQWSQVLNYSAGGQRSVVKQTAIRTGAILVVVSGSPALVDAHLAAAVRTALAH
ncbi:hypothetical protein [Streptomyces dysideae]|uniref:PknH-like extracellular domain-containing protein n=1 Tax=Streptomyces dysideae TaxID=909626 RepID=A0A101V455_9ACTN|nr:hypothetical protein [Streptomyces dysideae]KUO22165.1 hypothetical protein AQJ91_06240 [Streptomyces dysideae]